MKYFFIRASFHNPFPFKIIVLLPFPSDSIAIDWFVFQTKSICLRNYKKCTLFYQLTFTIVSVHPLTFSLWSLKRKSIDLLQKALWVNTPPKRRSMTHFQSYPDIAVRWTHTVRKTWTWRSCALTTAPFFALPALPANIPWWKQKCRNDCSCTYLNSPC